MTPVPVHTGRVSPVGVLVLDDPARFKRALIPHSGKPVEVVVRRIRVRRTSPQNRWYWGCVLALIGEFCGYTPEEAHAAMKWLFLRRPADVVGVPDTVRSTTDLTTVEFADYCEQVRRWAATELGLNIPDPHEVDAA